VAKGLRNLLGGAVVVACVGLVALLASKRPHRDGVGPGSDAAARERASVGKSPEGDLPASREESAAFTFEIPTDTADALTAPVLERIRAAAEIKAILADMTAGRLDPLDGGRKLEEALRGRADLAHPVIGALAGEKKPEVAFPLARALGVAQDDPDVRAATIDALKGAAPEARAVGLLALLGRGEPEALSLATACYLDDVPEARATAAFLLNNAPRGLPEADATRVRDAARAALSTRGTAPRVREESLGLLGREGAPEADLGLLERALLEPGDTAVRSRALASLFATNASGPRLRPTLERAMADPALPAQVREAARLYLLAH